MKILASALSRLQATALTPFGDRLSRPIDPRAELALLYSTVQGLEIDRDHKKRVSPVTLALAKALWRDSGGSLDSLSKLQIRALCGDVGVSTSKAFVTALGRTDAFPQCRRWIESLIANYFNAWRPAEPATIEALLQAAVRSFNGKSVRIAQCRPVAKDLFSARSAAWLGEQIIQTRQPWHLILEEWGVERAGRLAEATVNASVDAWEKHFAEAREGWGSTRAQQET